jgi:uncharacterized protein YjbI with pentapeptide repeats
MTERAQRSATEIDPNSIVSISDARLTGADYSGQSVHTLSVGSSELTDCKFDRMRIESFTTTARASVCMFVGCSFDDSHIALITSGFARFERCSFRGTNIGSWDSDSVELIDCVFSGQIRRAMFWARPVTTEQLLDSDARFRAKHGLAPLSDAYIAMAHRPINEFHGNDFSGADLVDVNFRAGIDLSRQTLPSGGDYIYLAEALATIHRVRDAIGDWPDDELSKANSMLKALMREPEEGQTQLLVRERWFRRTPLPVRSKIFELLRRFA